MEKGGSHEELPWWARVAQAWCATTWGPRCAACPKPSGDHLVALAAEGATWCNCLPDGVFDELRVSGTDNGHGHPTGVPSVVDGGSRCVAEVAWSMSCPPPAGGCSLSRGKCLIWGNVGSDLLPRAVLDVVEDGDAIGSPRRSTMLTQR